MPTVLPYTSNAPKVLPTAADGTALTPSGSAWTNGSYVQFTASTSAAWVLAGIVITPNSFSQVDFEIDVATGGAGSETVVASFCGRGSGSGDPRTFLNLPYLIDNIASGVRVAARIRCSSTSVSPMNVKLVYYEKPIVGTLPTTTQPSKVYPAAANAAGYTAGSTWANGSWVQIVASTATAIIVLGAAIEHRSNGPEFEVDLGTGGAGSETVVTTFRDLSGGAFNSSPYWCPLQVPLEIATSTRIACRARTANAATPGGTVKLLYMEKPL